MVASVVVASVRLWRLSSTGSTSCCTASLSALGRRYARGNVLQCLCVIYARVVVLYLRLPPWRLLAPFEVRPRLKTISAISLPALPSPFEVL